MEMNIYLQNLGLSGIRRFSAMAAEVGGCVMLTLGEPDFDTPKPIVEAAKNALDQGFTHYSLNKGSQALREAISAFEAEHRGLTYNPEEIIMTIGGSEAVYVAMRGVLNPGDEVIIPVPAYSVYETVAAICGAVPVKVNTADDGFRLTAEALERAITPKTKLLILNTPNNPTGIVYTLRELEAIRDVAKKYGFFVLSDDVYWGLDHCPTFSQFTELKDQILSVQSFSKPYAMTGWRVGYLMVSEKIAQKMTGLHAHVLSCVPTMLQQACLTALQVDPTPMAAIYKQRRDLVCGRLEKMGIPFFLPQGAFYVFPSIRHLGMSSEEFCTRLIKEAKVATVPGSVFGAEGFFRISYCCSVQELETGMDRLEAFLKSL